MFTKLVFKTMSTLLKLVFQNFLLAIVQGYGEVVLNQDIGPEIFLSYLIFWETRTGPQSVCLYKSRPGVLISVRLS